jgi:hypothetical protein
VERRGLRHFATPWELKPLDLSLEAFVLRPEYASWFTDEEPRITRARLKECGYPA